MMGASLCIDQLILNFRIFTVSNYQAANGSIASHSDAGQSDGWLCRYACHGVGWSQRDTPGCPTPDPRVRTSVNPPSPQNSIQETQPPLWLTQILPQCRLFPRCYLYRGQLSSYCSPLSWARPSTLRGGSGRKIE